MFFKKRKQTVEKSAKKFDNLITGLIIGGAIGWVFWIYKHNKAKKDLQQEDMMDSPEIQKINENSHKAMRRGYALFGKFLVKVIDIFDSKK